MKKFLSKALLAAAFAGLFVLGGFATHLAHAGQTWTQIPGGAIPQNNKVSVSHGTRVEPTQEYGWQVSGPFTATVTSVTATMILPASVCTNCVGYQGPFRLVFVPSQQVQFQPTSLTYGPGVTWTASTLGVICAANTIVDTKATFGEVWPNGNFAFQLSPTATSSANNLTYWVLDESW